MPKGKARTFGQDLMRGEHVVGETKDLRGGLTHRTTPDPYRTEKRGLSYGVNEWVRDKQAEGDLGGGLSAQHTGTSIFDPVLCEIAYRWFCPPGGTVLDPFAGGSVRGLVASHLGRPYVGIELRPEQVAANEAQLRIAVDPLPQWRVGDSRNIAKLAGDVDADLIFSCPPYLDLEVYSDDPRDLSTMGHDEFFAAQAAIIQAAVDRLKPDRFAVWIVGDVRDKAGFYANLPGRTIEAFRAAGAGFYNDAILVTAAGSLPIRAGKQFVSTRKLGKTHQNILVFCKGDPRKATEACGEVEFGEMEADDDLAVFGEQL